MLGCVALYLQNKCISIFGISIFPKMTNHSFQYWSCESPVIAGRKGSPVTAVFLSGKGTLSICGVTQFKELQRKGIRVNQGLMLGGFDQIQNKWFKVTVFFSGEPGPSVHHHSCHGRKPICATLSLLTSPHAPLSEWPGLRENLRIKTTAQNEFNIILFFRIKQPQKCSTDLYSLLKYSAKDW